MPIAQTLLVRQEGRALHEEHRERRHADVADRIGLVHPMTPVGERSAARAQVLDQGLKADHARVESYFAPVSVGSIDARSRIFAQLWLSRLTRVRACTGRHLQSGTALDRLRLGRIENC